MATVAEQTGLCLYLVGNPKVCSGDGAKMLLYTDGAFVLFDHIKFKYAHSDLEL